MNKQKTLKLIDGLEKRTKSMSDHLRSMDEETLNASPQPGAWSVTRIIQHLQISEELSHQYLERKLSYGNDLPSVGFSDILRQQLLGVSLRLPFKYKAPDMVIDAMEDRQDPYQLLTDWKNTRTELRAFLDGLSEDLYTKSIYRHPYAGKMPLAGMVKFFNWHQDRHFDQIRKTLKQVQKGK